MYDSSCFLQRDCHVSLEVLTEVVYMHARNTNQGGDIERIGLVLVESNYMEDELT